MTDNKPYRSQKWMEAVASLGECVNCGNEGVQVAHRNEGKGMGTKASDCLTAALCPHCHSMIDQGKEMSRAERRMMMDRSIVLTLEKLVKAGKVVVA